MKTYTNTHININYNFNLEAANASDLFIVASLTIVGLLWAGFAISKQNKDENTNVIEDSLSTKTDEICFCLENVVDKDTIKVNFAEKQIENVLVLLEKTLDYFLPYYSSVDINYIYNQLNIIIQLMLNGLDYSLNDYNFLLLGFNFMVAVKVGLSKLYLLYYFIKWKYIIYNEYYDSLDTENIYCLYLLLSFTTLLYNVYGPSRELYDDPKYLMLNIYIIADDLFKGDITFPGGTFASYSLFNMDFVIVTVLRIGYHIFIDAHWHDKFRDYLEDSEEDFLGDWHVTLGERASNTNFIGNALCFAANDDWGSKSAIVRYNMNILIDYLQGYTPITTPINFRNTPDGQDIIHQDIIDQDHYLVGISVNFTLLLENIIYHFFS